MAPEEISFNGYDYRTIGGEIHRRPVNPPGKKPWDGSWLVLNKKEPCETLPKVPPEVLAHFEQAKDHNFVD